MIIGPDSPLRRLPTALDRKQALFLDGIRFSVEMADLAYQRLRHTLLNFESSFDRSAAYSPGVVAMIDAWVIIDNVHRLAGLLRELPGRSKRSRAPVFRRLDEQCAVVERLRHSVQHLNHEMERILAGAWPAWGGFSWIVIAADGKWHMYAFLPGSPVQINGFTMAEIPESAELPVGRITLRFGEAAVDLGEVMRSVSGAIRDMEAQLQPQFANQATAGADLLMHMVSDRPSQPQQPPPEEPVR